MDNREQEIRTLAGNIIIARLDLTTPLMIKSQVDAAYQAAQYFADTYCVNPPTKYGLSPSQQECIDRVQAHCKNNDSIAAIKELRSGFHLGLKEAKDWIDIWEVHNNFGDFNAIKSNPVLSTSTEFVSRLEV